LATEPTRYLTYAEAVVEHIELMRGPGKSARSLVKVIKPMMAAIYSYMSN